jgi:hypothetical protein
MNKTLDEFYNAEETHPESNFSRERLQQAQELEDSVSDSITNYLHRVFDAGTIVKAEPGESFQTGVETRTLAQIIDFAGSDYVVDPVTDTPFGVNHRTHTPKGYELRFDIQSDTGTNAPSTLEELRQDIDNLGLLPRYASRLHPPKESTGWFRVVELQPLIRAVNNNGLRPDKVWGPNKNGRKAWMFDYSTIKELNALIADFEVTK